MHGRFLHVGRHPPCQRRLAAAGQQHRRREPLTGGTFADIIGNDPGLVITGSNNLVTVSALPLPADTITARPKLSEALRTMGGSTYVLVPSGNSPVLNQGNNVAALEWDQRGEPFPRVSGPGTDIGAFEMDWSEYLFADDFGDD